MSQVKFALVAMSVWETWHQFSEAQGALERKLAVWLFYIMLLELEMHAVSLNNLGSPMLFLLSI